MDVPFGLGPMQKLARLGLVSMVLFAALCFVNTAKAHELRPAIADVTVEAESLTYVIELALEALLAEIDVSVVDNTDEAPNAARYDALRLMAPAALEAELRAGWEGLSGNFLIQVGETLLVPEITAVEIPEVGDLDLVRDSTLTLTASLPAEGNVQVGWTANNGPLVIRQMGAGDNAYSALLDGGELSEPLPRGSASGGGLLRFLFGD